MNIKYSHKMNVVNVSVKYIRPSYKNLQDWMNDSNNVYIGRKGVVFIDGVRFPSKDSVWANPYKIGKDGNREEVIAKYESYIVDKITKKEVDLCELKGKILGCWCKSDAESISCHGDVLVKLCQ